MKIAITGANGFLGKRMSKMLQDLGHSVFAIPRDYLTSPKLLENTLEKFPPDHIIHLAAYGNHSHQTEETKMVNVNIVKTFNLFQATKNIEYQSLINVGSSSEYGNKKKPMKETDSLETDTFYGASKVAATYLARAFAKKYEKNIVTVRPFSIYGPGEAAFRFIPSACRSMLNDGIFSIVAAPKHDWTYVDDFCEGVYTVMINAEKLRGQVVNIGTGKQYSNIQVIENLCAVTKRNIKLNNSAIYERSYDSDDSWVANNKKIKNLGWKPRYTLRKGLERVFHHEKQEFEKENH